MNDQQWINRIALVAVGLVLLAGGFAFAVSDHPASARSDPGGGSAPIDHLYLTIGFNPVSGADQYFPANFTVPLGAVVVVTITNYDNGTNPVPAAYQQVTGTIGGTATVWSNGSNLGEVVSAAPGGAVAHTFTLQQGPYDLNVPVPPAGPTGAPTTVEFSVEFATAGAYTWECMAPCATDSMSAAGFMTGTVTVA